MRLEIICTGDEVLTGKIVNTNFSYISQKLEDVGLAVQWETTVGDDRESLLTAFQLADYKVRILNGSDGTSAVTRVLIDTRNGTERWTTVGASANIIEASWRALADAIEYGLTMAS